MVINLRPSLWGKPRKEGRSLGELPESDVINGQGIGETVDRKVDSRFDQRPRLITTAGQPCVVFGGIAKDFSLRLGSEKIPWKRRGSLQRGWGTDFAEETNTFCETVSVNFDRTWKALSNLQM